MIHVFLPFLAQTIVFWEQVSALPNINTPASKELLYNQNLLTDGFMVLTKYSIPNISKTHFTSHEQQMEQSDIDSHDDQSPKQEDPDSDQDEQQDNLYLVIYGKTQTQENWKFLTEAYIALQGFSMRLVPDEAYQLGDVSLLSDNTSFDITATNNLVVQYILSPMVYQIKIKLIENDCLSLLTFYDDSSKTLIEFDSELNMLHVSHEEGHKNYYFEEVMNSSGFDSKEIYKRNPFYEIEDEESKIYFNFICPFWKYTETNKLRGEGVLTYWNNLQVFYGESMNFLM
jgi:hypothetical protein